MYPNQNPFDPQPQFPSPLTSFPQPTPVTFPGDNKPKSKKKLIVISAIIGCALLAAVAFLLVPSTPTGDKPKDEQTDSNIENDNVPEETENQIRILPELKSAILSQKPVNCTLDISMAGSTFSALIQADQGWSKIRYKTFSKPSQSINTNVLYIKDGGTYNIYREDTGGWQKYTWEASEVINWFRQFADSLAQASSLDCQPPDRVDFSLPPGI